MPQTNQQTDPYLTSLVRTRAQRRSRGSDIIDPMDSAASMDRLQGAQVSDASVPVMDGGGAGGIIRLASNRGGGGGAVRTASMREGDEAPVRQTGNCQPGMACYRGDALPASESYNMGLPPGAKLIRETTTAINGVPVNRAPATTTVAPAAAPKTTTVSPASEPAPITSTVLPPVPSTFSVPIRSSVQPYLDRAVQDANSMTTFPSSGANLAAARIAAGADEAANNYTIRQQMLPYTIEATQAATEATRSAAAEHQASALLHIEEAELTKVQTELTAASTMLGLTDQEAQLSYEVARGKSVESAVNAVMAARARAPVAVEGADKKKSVGVGAAPEIDLTPAQQRAQLTRQFTAAQAAGGLFMTEAVQRQALRDKQAAGEAAGQYGPYLPDPRVEDVVRDQMDLFVGNMRQSGVLGMPWDKANAILEDDVHRTLRVVNMQRHTAGIDPSDRARYESASTRAVAEADAYFNAIKTGVKTAWNEHNSQTGITARSAGKQAPKSETIDSNDTLPSPSGAPSSGFYPVYGAQ